MSPAEQDENHSTFTHRIMAKEARRMRARRHRANSLWFGLGTFGMVGWSVSIPTVLGVMLGLWLESRVPVQFSWTLTLLITGLVIGCLNAWYWISKEQRLIQREREDTHDDE